MSEHGGPVEIRFRVSKDAEGVVIDHCPAFQLEERCKLIVSTLSRMGGVYANGNDPSSDLIFQVVAENEEFYAEIILR